jgi:hypothetical protein
LADAYGVFQGEAQQVQPGYRPRTVSVDGWSATRQAWLALYPLVVLLLRCFLHGWLNIRSRGKLDERFAELSGKVWEAYRAPDRRAFGQRLRRLWEWTRRHVEASWVVAQVSKLRGRSQEYGLAYASTAPLTSSAYASRTSAPRLASWAKPLAGEAGTAGVRHGQCFSGLADAAQVRQALMVLSPQSFAGDATGTAVTLSTLSFACPKLLAGRRGFPRSARTWIMQWESHSWDRGGNVNEEANHRTQRATTPRAERSAASHR